jgi:uncharacterized protein with PQ loop repeat
MDIIGWIGSILFAICGLPQAIQCVKDGHSRGLNWVFLICWLFGEIFTLAYVAYTTGDWVLLSNYLINLVFLATMLRYKISERKPKPERWDFYKPPPCPFA